MIHSFDFSKAAIGAVGGFLSLAFATSSLASPREDQIDYSTTSNAPVHLMRNGTGEVFAVTLDRDPATGALGINKRPVSGEEIAQLESAGVTLAFLPGDGESAESVAQSSQMASKQGGPVSSMPSSFTIMRLNGLTYGGFWTTSRGRPYGKTTHWSTFTLTSSGFSGTREHVAHALILDVNALSPSLGNERAIIGNGMLIGKSYDLPYGCGVSGDPGYYAQPEAFWFRGNRTYSEACTPRGLLKDDQSQTFTLHANINQWISFSVQPAGLTPFSAPPVNTAAARTAANKAWDPDQGGVLFTVTGGDGAVGTPDYILRFSNASKGWF